MRGFSFTPTLNAYICVYNNLSVVVHFGFLLVKYISNALLFGLCGQSNNLGVGEIVKEWSERGCAAIIEKRKLLLVLGAVSSFVFSLVLCIERECFCQVLNIQDKCLDSKFVYVGKPRTKTCLVQVLDIAQDCSSQDSRTVKLQKEDFRFCEARLIERKVRPIKSHFLQILNQVQSLQKRVTFQFNTTRCKRKNLTKFQKFLEVL